MTNDNLRHLILKSLLSYGNNKLPKTTAIFNLNSAFDCPSDKKGMCALSQICYAKQAEKQYPAVLPYRRRQAEYWNSVTGEQFAQDFVEATKTKTIKLKHLRFSEAGDVSNENDIVKLETIATILKEHGITCYIYTARLDLFSRFQALTSNLVVNTSGKKVKGLNSFKAVDKFSGKHFTCCADCNKCSLCATQHDKIVEVLKH